MVLVLSGAKFIYAIQLGCTTNSTEYQGVPEEYDDGTPKVIVWSCTNDNATCSLTHAGKCSEVGMPSYNAEDAHSLGKEGSINAVKGGPQRWGNPHRGVIASPITINMSMLNPLPQLSSIPNKYTSLSFPNPSSILNDSGTGSVNVSGWPYDLNILQPFLGSFPHNDPFIVGTSNSTSDADPTEIDSKGFIQASYKLPAGFGGNESLAWPPDSLYTHSNIWNKALSSIFEAYKENNQNNAKEYPITYWSLGNPAESMPSMPVTLKWKPFSQPAGQPAITGHHLHIVAYNGIDGLPTGLPNGGIDIVLPVTTLSYTFPGYGLNTYNWSVYPVDQQNARVHGDMIFHGSDGYSANPFNIQVPSYSTTPAHPGDPRYYDCSVNVGHIYFARGGADVGTGTPLCIGDNGYYFNGKPTGGYRPGYEFISWKKIDAARRYEIQFSDAPFPNSTPFTDLATFNFTSPAGGVSQHTTNVISNDMYPTAPLKMDDDLIKWKPGFQYNFASSPGAQLSQATIPGGNNANGVPSYVYIYWRVRGIDENNNPVYVQYYQDGIIEVPAPREPFSFYFPVWNKSASATAYVLDVAENIADLDKLPNLDASPTITPNTTGTTTQIGGIGTNTQTTQTNTASLAINGSGTSTTQIGTGEAPDQYSDLYVTRQIIPNQNYDSRKMVVNKFKDILEWSRISDIKVAYANGYYTENNKYYPYNPPDQPYDYANDDLIRQNAFLTGLYDYDSNIDDFFPKMTTLTGMNITPQANNQLVLTSGIPLIIINQSTGGAVLGISQNPSKTISTLSFGGTKGEYKFEIVAKNYGPSWEPRKDLHFGSFGPVPVIANGNLTGKVSVELPLLVPGQQYFWRQRCLNDPDPLKENAGATKMTFCQWSPIQSFIAPTLTPGSITVNPTTSKKQVAPTNATFKIDPNATKDTIEPEYSFTTTESKTDQTKAFPNAKIPKDKIDLSPRKDPTGMTAGTFKQRNELRKTLMRSYDALLKAKESKNADTIEQAQVNYSKAVKAAGAFILSTKDGRLGAAAVQGNIFPPTTVAGWALNLLIALVIFMIIRKIYFYFKIKKNIPNDLGKM